MKILIIGRTGSGKDYLAGLLKEQGMTQVLSYATRPKRKPDEATHIFIKKEEADAIPARDKVATTVINGYEYFATRKQVEENDIYIIDPKGFYELRSNMPETPFLIVYVDADKEEAKKRAVKRAANPEKEENVFEQRYAAEDEQFSAFETALETEIKGVDYLRFKNDFREETVKEVARQIVAISNTYKHLVPAVNLAKKSDILHLTEDGLIKVYTEKGEMTQTSERFAYTLSTQMEGIGYLMAGILSKPDVCIASGFASELSDLEAEEVTGYVGQILEELPATAETADARIWLTKLYNKAAKYLVVPATRG